MAYFLSSHVLGSISGTSSIIYIRWQSYIWYLLWWWRKKPEHKRRKAMISNNDAILSLAICVWLYFPLGRLLCISIIKPPTELYAAKKMPDQDCLYINWSIYDHINLPCRFLFFLFFFCLYYVQIYFPLSHYALNILLYTFYLFTRIPAYLFLASL